jgi:hypothetical protein
LTCEKNVWYDKNDPSQCKNKRSDIISKLFGSNGLVAAEDSFEFESKSENLISENPEFARYFDSRNQCSLRFLEYEL